MTPCFFWLFSRLLDISYPVGVKIWVSCLLWTQNVKLNIPQLKPKYSELLYTGLCLILIPLTIVMDKQIHPHLHTIASYILLTRVNLPAILIVTMVTVFLGEASGPYYKVNVLMYLSVLMCSQPSAAFMVSNVGWMISFSLFF